MADIIDNVTLLEHDSVAVLFGSGDCLKTSIAGCDDLGTLTEASRAIADAKERLEERLVEIARKKLELTTERLIA